MWIAATVLVALALLSESVHHHVSAKYNALLGQKNELIAARVATTEAELDRQVLVILLTPAIDFFLHEFFRRLRRAPHRFRRQLRQFRRRALLFRPSPPSAHSPGSFLPDLSWWNDPYLERFPQRPAA